MSCYQDLIRPQPIFSIVLSHRGSEPGTQTYALYIFFGNNKQSAAMKKFKQGMKLNNTDKNSIRKEFPKNYATWMQFYENSKIYFIDDVIRPDETLYTVRKK